MMRIFKQIRRGLGYLPIVGDHPGNAALVFFVGIALLVGFSSSAVAALLLIVPIAILHLIGAYSRAEFNDREEKNV